MDKVVVIGDLLSAPHQTTLALLDEVEEVMNPSVEPSPHPTPPALDICIDVDCKPVGCHMNLFSQPLSSRSVHPPNLGVFYSSIPDFAYDVHEDQAGDGVGVE